MAQTLALGGISTQTVQKAAGEFSKPEGYGAVLGAGAAVALEKLLFSSMRGLFGYAIRKGDRVVYVAPDESGDPDPENPLEIAPLMRLLAKAGLALAGASVYIGSKDKMAKFAGLGIMAVAGFHVAEDLLALVGVEL